jgi:hypothetical protein
MTDRRPRRVSITNVVFGLGYVVAAALLLGERAGVLALDSSIIAPLALTAIGLVLLLRGLLGTRDER